jgi:hypothetical protein
MAEQQQGLTYQQLAQQALDIQDASNLSGVAHAFSRGVRILSDEARKRGEGTEWVNEHPIVSLFLDKLASLNHIQNDPLRVCLAYGKVEAITKNQPEGTFPNGNSQNLAHTGPQA